MYKYPYGDSQQLNLDWIISKIKELEAGGSGGAADLEAVANALVTLSFNLNTQYRRYDYCFLNGKLYRCLSDTSGVFDPSAWQEALIGDDLAVLTRWINAIDAAAVVDVKFDTSGTNGKLQQKYHDEYHDVVEVDYTPVQNSKRPLSSNAGYELNGAINTKQDILTIVSQTPYGTECPATNSTVIASINITTGTWLIVASHDWTANVSAYYADNIRNITQGAQILNARNLSMANGGGASQSVIYKATVSCTIEYSTYNGDSSARTADHVKLFAIKIA